MEQRQIGTLRVSVAGLGANNFGMRVDHDTSIAVIRRALDVGVTVFDTADVYGRGRSETWLGEALAPVRDEVVVATKFGWPDTRGLGLTGPDPVASLERSLERLRTDRVDLLYVHQPDLGVAIEETLGALDGLVREGKVREIGYSNVTADHLFDADDAATTHGYRQFACVEDQYNLLWRRPEADLLPACAQLGTRFVPFFPLANGLLTGKYRLDALPDPSTRLGWALAGGSTGSPIPTDPADARAAIATAMDWHPHDKAPVDLDVVAALAAFAAESGHTMLELALGWLAARPEIPTVIAGATSPAQVTANAAATACVLTPDVLTRLDELTAPAEPVA